MSAQAMQALPGDYRSRLSDADAEVRRIAVMELPYCDEDDFVDLALAALSDTSPAVRAEAAKALEGIDQVNVIYRSGAEMLTSLLKDEADTAIITVSTALGQIREGKVRALAGVSMQPMKQLPDVPPVGRTIPGFDVKVWHGIVGPAGMDPAVVRKLHDEIISILKTQDMQDRIKTLGFDVIAGSPEQFAAQLKEDIVRWGDVARRANIVN